MVDDLCRGPGRVLLVGDAVTEPERARPLPTGTVTFLLTDVEGSSRRWDGAPEAMATAIARHYEILGDAVARHGGVRPVEQGEGDSIVAAFSRASDALAAALDAQRHLLAERWPERADLHVRMAIHTGDALLRDEGNYFGPAVIRCARLRAIGHGGQVLISDATAALVADGRPDEADLVDLGVHRLKDLGRPERVWQLVHPALPGLFAPLLSLDAFRHNLPIQLTPLIGRGKETAEVGALLGDERLVTLVGTGGVGKTRLALAVAADAVERFPGGVWLTELAGLSDPDGVPAAALAAIGAHQASGQRPVDQLAAELGRSPSLLLLDNCEHLVEGCATTAAAVLAANGAATVLATSREPLDVPGEVTWRVPSLSAPPLEVATPAPELSEFEAARLFLDRAKRARPSFVVTDDNAPAIARICQRLDGIPLALELAAARVRQLTPERIASELDDRFRLLAGGSRTVLPRHQTLAASIDWSHERLDPLEQVVFRCLGVFTGRFPLEAAEAVVASMGDVDEADVFGPVSRLVDKGLVLVEDGLRGEPAYRLLETLRAYALDRVNAAGAAERLRWAHVEFWRTWLERRWLDLHTDPVAEEVDAVHANLVAALEWSLGDPGTGLEMLRLLARAWLITGRSDAAMVAVDRLLTDEQAAAHPRVWVRAAFEAIEPVFEVRDWEEAMVLARRTQRWAEQLDDPVLTAAARTVTSTDIHALEAVRELAVSAGDRFLIGSLMVFRAIDLLDADPLTADELLSAPELVAIANESRFMHDLIDEQRATAARGTGDLCAAVELTQRLLTSRAGDGGVWPAFWVSLLAADDALATAAVARAGDIPASPKATSAVQTGAHVLELLQGGSPELSTDLAPESIGKLVLPTVYVLAREGVAAGEADQVRDWLRASPRASPHGRAVLAAVEGLADRSEERWHEALSIAAGHGLRIIATDALEALVILSAAAERWVDALRLAGAAARLRVETGYRWRFPTEQQQLDDALSACRAALGTGAAQAAILEGQDLEWREAAAYAARTLGAS
jgi:predicted ATPase/class 3 adenylate cyclase